MREVYDLGEAATILSLHSRIYDHHGWVVEPSGFALRLSPKGHSVSEGAQAFGLEGLSPKARRVFQ